LYFQKLERVEFRDTDAAGIAHFSVFFNWMERTEHAFLRHLGLSVVSWQPAAGERQARISWPRVKAECDYRRSVAFEEVFGVQLEIARLGRKACTYRFRFLEPARVAMLPDLAGRENAGWEQAQDWFADAVEPFAEGSLTAVCCWIEAGRVHQSIEILPDWRSRLQPFVSSSAADPSQ